jgi:hypothetical protein
MLLQPLLTDAVSDILAVSSVSQSSMCSTPGVGLPLVIATVGNTGCTGAVDWFLLTDPRTSVCDRVRWLVGSDKSTKISNVASETSGWNRSQGHAENYNSRHGGGGLTGIISTTVATVECIYICGLQYKQWSKATKKQGNTTQGIYLKCHFNSTCLLSSDVP